MKILKTSNRDWLVLVDNNGNKRDIIIDRSTLSAIMLTSTSKEKEFIKQYIKDLWDLKKN